MEKRADDRFPVQSRAVVIPVNDSSQPLDALLADVSASGLRLIVSKDLGEGAQIVVELESNIALAEVRYLNPRGDKFVLGARKLATIPRVDLPEDATWEQKLAQLTGRPTFLAAKAVDDLDPALIETVTTPPVAALMPNLKISIPLPVRPQPALRGVSVETVAEPRTSIVLQNSSLDIAPADIPAPALTPMTPPPAEPLPDIREYMRAVQKPQISEAPIVQNDVVVRRQNRSRLGLIASAAVACLLAVAAAGFYWHPAQGSSEQISASKATKPKQEDGETAAATVASAAVAVKPTPAHPAANATSTTAAPSTAQAHQAALQTTSISWVAVCTDTKEQVRKLMQDGDHVNFSFDQKAVVRMGSSGAGEITVDGKSIGPLGPLGSPRVLLVKSSGFEYLAGLPADGSGDCPTR
ncbi:MAG: RodZ domain-containing protein [Bryobacteraceae bacterium]